MEEKRDSYAPRTLTGMRLHDLLDIQDLKPLVEASPCNDTKSEATQPEKSAPTYSNE